jgi:hypothetical protein
MIRPDVILGVEYNYTDLQAKTHHGIAAVNVGGTSFTEDVSMRVDPDAIPCCLRKAELQAGARGRRKVSEVTVR